MNENFSFTPRLLTSRYRFTTRVVDVSLFLKQTSCFAVIYSVDNLLLCVCCRKQTTLSKIPARKCCRQKIFFQCFLGKIKSSLFAFSSFRLLIPRHCSFSPPSRQKHNSRHFSSSLLLFSQQFKHEIRDIPPKSSWLGKWLVDEVGGELNLLENQMLPRLGVESISFHLPPNSMNLLLSAFIMNS